MKRVLLLTAVFILIVLLSTHASLAGAQIQDKEHSLEVRWGKKVGPYTLVTLRMSSQVTQTFKLRYKYNGDSFGHGKMDLVPEEVRETFWDANPHYVFGVKQLMFAYSNQPVEFAATSWFSRVCNPGPTLSLVKAELTTTAVLTNTTFADLFITTDNGDSFDRVVVGDSQSVLITGLAGEMVIQTQPNMGYEERCADLTWDYNDLGDLPEITSLSSHTIFPGQLLAIQGNHLANSRVPGSEQAIYFYPDGYYVQVLGSPVKDNILFQDDNQIVLKVPQDFYVPQSGEVTVKMGPTFSNRLALSVLERQSALYLPIVAHN